jgi:glucuronoarabinoxylan endo-1,4-beta-xylanase
MKKVSLFLFLSVILAASAINAGTCTVDATTTYQYIHCIGASSAWSSIGSMGTQLFADDTVNGHIGLTSLRARIDPTNNFSPEVSTLVSAKNVNSNILFWATEWSPPAQYKANDNVDGGASNDTFNGASSGSPNSADTGLASYQVSFIQYCKNQGVDLYALSVQNEPNFNPTYEACLWTAGQFDVYVQAFHSALSSAGLSTKIMIPEPDNPGGMNLASTAMADSNSAPYVGIIATHMYGENPAPISSYGFSNVTNQEWWETEISGNTTDISGALQEAGWIQTSLVDASMNAFHYWWLQDLISNNALDIKAFVLGNYSKFIRPGYYRMAATESPTSGVSISAFKDTNNSSPSKIVFVAINNNTSSVSQTFNLNGLNVSSVTPWLTDSSTNLVAQSAVTVSNNTFTYSLPAQSVVSFVGTNNGGSAPTNTNTPVPATNTPTKTNTPVPATNTFTKTNTPVPPTNTYTPTNTFTKTNTPTNTFTKTNTPITPSATASTPVPTNTPITPSATASTPVPTNTPITPSATPTTPVPTNTSIVVPTATPTTPVPTNTPIPTFTPTTTTPASGAFTLYLLSAVTTNSTNSPHPQIELVNTGTSALNLNNVEVRYWLNCDCTGQSVQVWVDWAGLMPAGTSVTGNIQATVVPTTLGGQTDYISYKFTGNMVLQPGQNIQIQSRFNLSDWSNMLQDNDWSFAPYTSFTKWTQITGYLNGSLVWGQEPSGSSAALTTASALAYPNPSTGNGVNVSVSVSGSGTTASSVSAKSVSASSNWVDPDAQMTMKVYTTAGRLIWSKTFEGASIGSSGSHLLYWNEKDLRGANLASGAYIAVVTVKSHGQTTSATTKILILK